MDNQPGPIQSGLLAPPFTFLTNLLLLYHSNPVTLVLQFLAFQSRFCTSGPSCCSLCLCPSPGLSARFIPSPPQVFTQIPITFSMRSVLHPPPITSPLFLLPLVCFIFSCMCGCVYKTVHYRNFQTYTKVERV